MTPSVLVLWDIDRTLVYVGETDRLIYRQLVQDLLGHPAERLPAKGTGRTVPLAVRELLGGNGAPADRLDALVAQALDELPGRLAGQREHMLAHGVLLPGAVRAARAVHEHPDLVAGVVTGNLQGSAEYKLAAFGLDRYMDTTIGAYSSDDAHRPALVAIAQQRAGAACGQVFTQENTVIVGDSLEDVTTGLEGGARVIGVASGTTPAAVLGAAGAHRVLTDLTDPAALVAAIGSLTTGSAPLNAGEQA